MKNPFLTSIPHKKKYVFFIMLLFIISIILLSLNRYYIRKHVSHTSPSYSQITSPSNFNIPHDTYKKVFTPDSFILIGNVTKELNIPNFWISNYKASENIQLPYDKIAILNRNIQNSNLGVYDLKNYSIPSKAEIVEYINSYSLKLTDYYSDNNIKYSPAEEKSINNNRNLAMVASKETSSYGLTINKTNIRSYPTEIGAYSNPNSQEIDILQQSSLEVNQPVVILHESLDKKWYFVQGYNYRGWCKVSDIAKVKNKEELFNYINSSKFLMLTGNHVKAYSLKKNTEYTYNMGSKIFLAEKDKSTTDISQQIVDNNYIIKISEKDMNDYLCFELGKIPFKEDINYGYLPYTTENVLLQAFKCLGNKYDWGNKYDSRDCSGFVASVYNTMGFQLPRDTGPMEKVPALKLKFSGNRLNQLDALIPGSLLFMKNHVTMYLGKYNGTPYMIHAFVDAAGGIKANQVAVTPVELPYNNYSSFLDKFSSALTLVN